MSVETSSTPDYTMGFSEEFIQILRRPAPKTRIAHLLPHLRSGIRILDFGCGPGNISLGLARTVSPGEVHGVDMEESQIELARHLAGESGQDNAFFHVGDVTALEFEDGWFDVAYCHNVLTHLPDTQAALSEVRRVLKPGGIIACRELVFRSSFLYPAFGSIEKAFTVMEDVLTLDDGHPQKGRELPGDLAEAGFEDIKPSASWESFATPEEVYFLHRFAFTWFLSPEITTAAIKYGVATEELFSEIRNAFDRWRDNPSAWASFAYGEALGRNP